MANKIKGLAVVDSSNKTQHKILDDGNVELGSDESVDSRLSANVELEGNAAYTATDGEHLADKLAWLQANRQTRNAEIDARATSLAQLQEGAFAENQAGLTVSKDGESDITYVADATANYSGVRDATTIMAADKALDAAAQTVETLVTTARQKVLDERAALLSNVSAWANTLSKIEAQMKSNEGASADLQDALASTVEDLTAGLPAENAFNSVETAIEDSVGSLGALTDTRETVYSNISSESGVSTLDELQAATVAAQIATETYLDGLGDNPPDPAILDALEAAQKEADAAYKQGIGAISPFNWSSNGTLLTRQHELVKQMSTDYEPSFQNQVNEDQELFNTDSLVVSGKTEVETLDVSQNNTAMKIPMKTAADAATAAAAATTADGISSQDGEIIYLLDAGAAPFDVADKFYFCEDGEWFMSPFTSVVETFQDIYDAAITTALAHLDAGTSYTDQNEFDVDIKIIEVSEKEAAAGNCNLHARHGELSGANFKAAYAALDPQNNGGGNA